MKILELDDNEMKLVMLAVTCEPVKMFVQEPSTPYMVRQVYKSLLEKLKNAKEKSRIIMPD